MGLWIDTLVGAHPAAAGRDSEVEADFDRVIWKLNVNLPRTKDLETGIWTVEDWKTGRQEAWRMRAVNKSGGWILGTVRTGAGKGAVWT